MSHRQTTRTKPSKADKEMCRWFLHNCLLEATDESEGDASKLGFSVDKFKSVVGSSLSANAETFPMSLSFAVQCVDNGALDSIAEAQDDLLEIFGAGDDDTAERVLNLMKRNAHSVADWQNGSIAPVLSSNEGGDDAPALARRLLALNGLQKSSQESLCDCSSKYRMDAGMQLLKLGLASEDNYCRLAALDVLLSAALNTNDAGTIQRTAAVFANAAVVDTGTREFTLAGLWDMCSAHKTLVDVVVDIRPCSDQKDEHPQQYRPAIARTVLEFLLSFLRVDGSEEIVTITVLQACKLLLLDPACEAADILHARLSATYCEEVELMAKESGGRKKRADTNIMRIFNEFERQFLKLDPESRATAIANAIVWMVVDHLGSTCDHLAASADPDHDQAEQQLLAALEKQAFRGRVDYLRSKAPREKEGDVMQSHTQHQLIVESIEENVLENFGIRLPATHVALALGLGH